MPDEGFGSKAEQEAAWRGYVARMAAGDQSGLAALYDESSRLIYSIVLRIVRRAEDAEEVTLDVFTQVWKTAKSYDASRGSVAAWLVMSARSRAIDRIRARAPREENERPMPDVFDVPTTRPTPERETEDSERRRRVASALSTLSEEQRELLQLAFFSGLSHSELAARLNQPLGTVKTRIRAGMMKLREQLEPLAV